MTAGWALRRPASKGLGTTVCINHTFICPFAWTRVAARYFKLMG